MTPIPIPDLRNGLDEQEIDAIHDDEITFSGIWTDEVLRRAGAYFDVPAAAVRRRMGGRLG